MGRELPSPRRSKTQDRSHRPMRTTKRSPLKSRVQGSATKSTVERPAPAPQQISGRASQPPPLLENAKSDTSIGIYINDDVERFHSVETKMDLLNDQIAKDLTLNESKLKKGAIQANGEDEGQAEDADEWEDEMVDSDDENEPSDTVAGRATVSKNDTVLSEHLPRIDKKGAESENENSSPHGATGRAIETARHNSLNESLPSPHALSDSTKSTEYSSSQKRQAGVLGKTARNEAFIKLLETSKKFRHLMSTLNGLREWWHSNHQEWRQKRKEMHDMISRIANLNSQIQFYMEQYEGSAQGSKEHFRFKAEENRGQVELAEAEAKHKMDWFFAREQLMGRVRDHFKDMKAEYNLFYANSKREPKTVLEIAKRVDFVKKSKRTFKWWLRCAAEDLELATVILEQKVQEYETGVAHCDNRIETLQDRRRNDKVQQQETEKHLSEELLVIEQNIHQQATSPLDNSMDREALQYQEAVNIQLYKEALDRKHQAQMKREQQEAERLENKGRRTALLEEREIHALALLSYQEQLRRSVAVLSAIKVWLKAQPHENPNTKELDTQFHSLICVHQNRQLKGRGYLHLMVERSASLNNSDRIYILQNAAKHIVEWEEAENVFGLRLPENLFREGWLKSLLDMYEKEEAEFMEVVNSANQRHRDAKAHAASQTKDLGLSAPAFASAKSSSTVSQGGSVWKVNSSMAGPILSSTISYESVDGLLREDTVYHFLKSLLRQPDISPKIMDIDYYKDRHQLLRHLNRFIKYQVTLEQIEAFLRWCQGEKLFFELAQLGGKIRTIPFGWELYDESFYDRKGPARTPLLLKPPLANELAMLLRNNQAALKLDRSDRNITESKLIERINHLRVELPKNTDRKGFHDAFLYFSMSGKLFRFLPPTNETRDNLIMHRIDNGWKSPGNPASTRWLPNFPEPPAYYHRIRDLVVSRDIQHLLVQQKPRDKDSLHATLVKYFRDKGTSFVVRGGVEVTAWRFYLFLRYCDQIHQLFYIYRNGSVEFIEPGWR